MCGLVAIVNIHNNGFNYSEISIFKDLLFMDTLRGKDSTGVFGVDNKGNVLIHKEATYAPVFLERQELKDFFNGAWRKGTVMVGHNRAATRGSITDENAHPFVVDNKIVLVQNGTYKGSHEHLKKTEVDTEAVAHVLAETENVEEALQKINASYALMWYNADQRKFSIIRNDQRPLFCAVLKNGTHVYASEKDMLQCAISRNKGEIEDGPFEIKPGVLNVYTFTNDGYTLENLEGDYKYHYPKSGADSMEYPFHYKNAWGVEDDYGYSSKKSNIYPLNKDKAAITHTIMEILAENNRPRFSMLDINKFRNKYNYGKEVILEACDYVPANDHRECSVFYILAKEITPEASNNLPLFYWLIRDTEETKVLQHISDSIFRGKCDNIAERYISGSTSGLSVGVAVKLLHEPTIIPTLTHAKN